MRAVVVIDHDDVDVDLVRAIHEFRGTKEFKKHIMLLLLLLLLFLFLFERFMSSEKSEKVRFKFSICRSWCILSPSSPSASMYHLVAVITLGFGHMAHASRRGIVVVEAAWARHLTNYIPLTLKFRLHPLIFKRSVVAGMVLPSLNTAAWSVLKKFRSQY